MSILERLKVNKGTVSSELGKMLALEVLNGNKAILEEAITLTCYSLRNKEEKNIRAGAAKIVECVAMKQPTLVSPFLEKLLPALEAAEPQTRWMIIRTFGLCAKGKPVAAQKAIPYAKKYIREKTDGQLCLVSSADIFLGDYGALSRENANEIFQTLLESCDNVITNEHDWIIESFVKVGHHLSKKQKEEAVRFARGYEKHPRKKTLVRVKRLLKMCE
jgi:hypothetical protein